MPLELQNKRFYKKDIQTGIPIRCVIGCIPCNDMSWMLQIKESLSSDFIKCGYMQKTPAGTIKVCNQLSLKHAW